MESIGNCGNYVPFTDFFSHLISGESFTFLTHSHDDIWKASGIVEIMKKNGQYPPPEIDQLIERQKQRAVSHRLMYDCGHVSIFLGALST